MRQRVTVVANDGDVRVEVSATIATVNGYRMTREEQKIIQAELADELMRALPRLPYTSFRLSSLRVHV